MENRVDQPFGALGRMRSIVALSGVTLLLAACSSGTGGSTSATASASASASTASASASASESTVASAGEEHKIEVADSSLGQILTDQDGKTVYRFTPDSAGTSTCTGGCLDNWPPVSLEEGETVTAGDGVSGEVSTMTREDGTIQVTVNGFPVYFFSGDSAAGDVNGQGIGSKWYVMTADGEMHQQ